MDVQKLHQLTEAYITDTISAQEGAELAQMLQQPEYQTLFKELIHTQLHQQILDLDSPADSSFERILQSLETQIHQKGSIRRIPFFLRGKNISAAAILILAIGSGIYYFNTQSYKSQKSNESQFRQKTQATIPPGSNKAIWTLSSGKQIELDSTILDMTTKQATDNGFNELRTPCGGQYQLILPDGSKVWLNATSSIKYPVVFDGKERRVEVTGEAYFEIEKDVNKPFKVLGGGQEIEVLGTSFNINAYDDEPIQKTTLLTGSIRITNNNQTVTLKPNQQAQIINAELLIINSSPAVIAWKQGYFNFNKLPLKEAMRQIARWYNIDIVYDQDLPNVSFYGEVERSLSLQQTLKLLSGLGVQFKLENKTLHITKE